MATENTCLQPNAGDPCTSLLSIPSQFGRLLHLASLARAPGQANGHLAAFEGWLALNLREKQADVEVCAASHGCSAMRFLLPWARHENHKHLIPASAAACQRELFVTELEVLLLLVGG